MYMRMCVCMYVCVCRHKCYWRRRSGQRQHGNDAQTDAAKERSQGVGEVEAEGAGEGGKVETEETADGAQQLGLMLPLKEMQLKRISRPLKDLMPACSPWGASSSAATAAWAAEAISKLSSLPLYTDTYRHTDIYIYICRYSIATCVRCIPSNPRANLLLGSRVLYVAFATPCCLTRWKGVWVGGGGRRT